MTLLISFVEIEIFGQLKKACLTVCETTYIDVFRIIEKKYVHVDVQKG